MDRSKTMPEFIADMGIHARVERAATNPLIADMGRDARHWLVTLTNHSGNEMAVPFSQGSAHTKPPTAAEVLSCLADDAATLDDAVTFEEWAMNFGYDTDSRSAERTYNTVKEQTNALVEWLGSEGYAELLYKTERDG